MATRKGIKLLSKVMARDPAVEHLCGLLTRSQRPDTPSDVAESIHRVLGLIEARENYCQKLTMPEPPNTRMICEKTYKMPWKKLFDEGKVKTEFSPVWMSGYGEAQFLQFLIRMQKAKRVLEIGMFTGYVAMAMAETLPEDGVVVTCEIEPYLVEMARETFDGSPYGKKIEIRQGLALDSLDNLAEECQHFDIIYLDADKATYPDYYKIMLNVFDGMSLIRRKGE
ncbi:caffeoyl-CoA O-methyltransferase 1-like isoform X2 [Haliotis rufescens]|uniref:caffeoyl-CoA O-methyltransferase 1-like isoform X2 n=1 Tax=Haliotis rufescens TaxID=6454 RepID=UPI00201F9307|nr:caffeoyl-CoA O-methyltransferase 1-like isoform X2 [Haliotis rufescens]